MARVLVRFPHLVRGANISVRFCQFNNCMSAIVRSECTTAKRLVYGEYGDPLKVVNIDEQVLPPPKDNEVMVRMLMAPVNPADINTVQGVYPSKPPLPAVGGNEGVGEVVAAGSGVQSMRVGDRVVPRQPGFGTWRSFAVCPETSVMKVSKDLDLVHAATLTVNPCTAYRMLKDFVKLKPGDTVIQNGANGFCGHYVIQLCKAWGIQSVNIVRNRPDLDELKNNLHSLGATCVLTEEEVRSTEVFKNGSLPKPRLALNSVGGKNCTDMVHHMNHKGFVVTYGGMSRQPVTIPTSAFIFKDIRSVGYWMTRWSKENDSSPERQLMFDELTKLMVEGKVRVPPHTPVPVAAYKEVLEKAMNPKGFAGTKYILTFES